MNASPGSLVIASVLLAIGLATAGFFVGDGVSQRGRTDNIISVKGLSEKEVPASVSIWTISYTTTGNDLREINLNLGTSTKAVREFLVQKGFAEGDLAVQPPYVNDLSLVPRDKDEPAPSSRFSASQSVLLRTTKVDAVKPAVAAISELMQQGVLLSGRNEPNYVFDKLNDIKPGMIEEATQNARTAATRFASHSEVTLGKLRTASQGWFQVEDRDAATPERKIVRVVVEVVYEVK